RARAALLAHRARGAARPARARRGRRAGAGRLGIRRRGAEAANIARTGTGGEKIMLGRLMPREGRFFELFNAHAERIVEGSRELASMIGAFSELDAHAQRIDASERAADKITHETIALLHKTFITPFDREQIHTLITTMDDILDLIQDVAESVALYDLRKVTQEAKQLAEICQMCCDRVKSTVELLPDIKHADGILKCRSEEHTSELQSRLHL